MLCWLLRFGEMMVVLTILLCCEVLHYIEHTMNLNPYIRNKIFSKLNSGLVYDSNEIIPINSSTQSHTYPNPLIRLREYKGSNNSRILWRKPEAAEGLRERIWDQIHNLAVSQGSWLKLKLVVQTFVHHQWQQD